jgi:ribosome maturation factor RimP
MIKERYIRELAQQQLEGTDMFVVRVIVKPGNRIQLILDGDRDLRIEDCMQISRFIEGKLDRDSEDFELTVSSAGLDQPFSMIRQYRKYLNREVEILMHEGSRFSATLKDVTDQEIAFIRHTKKGVKNPKQEESEQRLPFSEIKETRPAIVFKK